MTYTRPTYSELKDRIAADLAAIPLVLSGPLSVMWAQAAHGQHGHLDWIAKQCSPLTCELERLHDWASLYSVPRLMATAATGSVLATGNIGSQLLADHPLRASSGLDYTATNAVELSAGPTPVRVRCTAAGSAGNLASGQVLTLVDPALGVNNSLTVDAVGIAGGAEDEDVEAWRLRVAEEWQTVTSRGARSGKPEDYIAWAKRAHPSVTGALVQPHVLGMGSVIVRPICDSLAGRVPTPAVLAAVDTFLLSIAPATGDWRLAVPLQRQVQPVIHLQDAVDNQSNRDSISAALQALVLSKVENNARLLRAEVDGAIGRVTNQYELTSPTETIQAAPGEILVFAQVVWQ